MINFKVINDIEDFNRNNNLSFEDEDSVQEEVQDSVQEEVQDSVQEEVQDSVQEEVQDSVQEEVEDSVQEEDEDEHKVLDSVQNEDEDSIQNKFKKDIEDIFNNSENLECIVEGIKEGTIADIEMAEFDKIIVNNVENNNKIDELVNILDSKNEDNEELRKSNIANNIGKLATFLHYDPDFFDKLKFIFDKFNEGSIIKEFVSHDGKTFFLRLISEDGTEEMIPL